MKIAICTPVHGDPKFHYTESLAQLLIATSGFDIAYLATRNSLLPWLRTSLATEALKWGADKILWIDADQRFPVDSLARLARHDKAFVGCNISRKADPAAPTAMGLDNKPVWTTVENAAVADLEEVASIGLGMALIAREVFEKTPEPWFWPDKPMGEDVWFCQRVREAGFGVYVDHQLSWQVGHVGDRVFYPQDTIMDRARFKMKHKLK